jgi:hypothetical protein
MVILQTTALASSPPAQDNCAGFPAGINFALRAKIIIPSLGSLGKEKQSVTLL